MNASLHNRMKDYEGISQISLMRKTPCIIRLDGKAFHTFTSGLDKPFDRVLVSAMQQTMKVLCEQIQGCVLGYTQSDEITLVLCDYQKIDTDCWYGYNVQKMCSVAASIATLAFQQAFTKSMAAELNNESCSNDRALVLYKKMQTPAYFDARCFSLPKDEVINCLIWRQNDGTRNSIQALAQSYWSQKELNKLKTNQLLDKLIKEKDVNWNSFPTSVKRGSCCIREGRDWIIDKDIPIFTQNRDYINSRITFNEE